MLGDNSPVALKVLLRSCGDQRSLNQKNIFIWLALTNKPGVPASTCPRFDCRVFVRTRISSLEASSQNNCKLESLRKSKVTSTVSIFRHGPWSCRIIWLGNWQAVGASTSNVLNSARLPHVDQKCHFRGPLCLEIDIWTTWVCQSSNDQPSIWKQAQYVFRASNPAFV